MSGQKPMAHCAKDVFQTSKKVIIRNPYKQHGSEEDSIQMNYDLSLEKRKKEWITGEKMNFDNGKKKKVTHGNSCSKDVMYNNGGTDKDDLSKDNPFPFVSQETMCEVKEKCLNESRTSEDYPSFAKDVDNSEMTNNNLENTSYIPDKTNNIFVSNNFDPIVTQIENEIGEQNSNTKNNSDGATQQNILKDKPKDEFFCFKVFSSGLLCKDCGVSVKRSAKSLKRHLKKYHTNLLSVNCSKLSRDIAIFMNTIPVEKILFKGPFFIKHGCLDCGIKYDHHEELLQHQRGSSTCSMLRSVRLKYGCLVSGNVVQIFDRYFCFYCHKSYGNKKFFLRHLRVSEKCPQQIPVLANFVKDQCGNFVNVCDHSENSIENMYHNQFSKLDGVPRPEHHPIVLEAITPLVPKDDDPFIYATMLLPLCSVNTDILFTISEDVKKWMEEPSQDERNLIHLIEMGRKWIMDRAKFEVGLLYGHHRAGMMQFSNQEVGDINQNITYNFRHNEETVAEELRKLLMFLWRTRDDFIDAYCGLYKEGIKEVPFQDKYLVQYFITYCFHQKVHSCYKTTLMRRYTLSRFFRLSKSEELSMVGSGTNASTVCTVLSLCRAAVCSVITASSNVMVEGDILVRLSRNCAFANNAGTDIRQLREMERRKNNGIFKTLDRDGNVGIDQHIFPRVTWCRLIPIIVERAKEIFGRLFVGDSWKDVLDCNIGLKVASDFSFSADGILGNAFRVCGDANVVDYDKLQAIIDFCFDGLGGASCRETQVTRLQISNLVWHRSCVYFYYKSIKVYSYKSNIANQVLDGGARRYQVDDAPLKLPQIVSMIFLLYRVVLKHFQFDPTGKFVVVERSGSKYNCQNLVKEIFDLKENINRLQIRHFITSLQNWIMPSKEVSDRMFPDRETAELNGHTEGTHIVRYSSKLLGARETLYRQYHVGLGDRMYNKNVGQSIKSSDLLLSMESVFGEKAKYRCEGQKNLCEAIVNSRCHVHADMPCGSGKSASWLLPVAARIKNMQTGKTTIVVTPYKFLNSFHLETAHNQVKGNVWIEGYSASDFGQLVRDLSTDVVIPDLMFLTIDCLKLLVQENRARLLYLCREGIVDSFILDEIHTVYSETFRNVYDILFGMVVFGVPLITMSGTLPPPFRPYLLKALGMDSGNVNDVQIIVGGDVVGDFPRDFKFDCHVVDDIKKVGAKAIVDKLKDSAAVIHVICSSKNMAMDLYEEMDQAVGVRIEDVILLTADVAMVDQAEIAALWRGGLKRLLISTSIAVLGNENKKCRHVFIIGYLYSITNIIQAINRLRHEQRFGGSSITILLPKQSASKINEIGKEERLKRYIPLREKNLVPNNETIWKKYDSTEGIHRVFVVGKECYTKTLSGLFGKQREDCGICTRCKSKPVQRTARRQQTMMNHSTLQKSNAMEVFYTLYHRCYVCKMEQCSGEECADRNSCYICFGNHFRRDCKVKWGDSLKGIACYSCLDYHRRDGYEKHDDKSKCPLGRRLKRLVRYMYQSQLNLVSDIPIEEYYKRICTDPSNFYSAFAKVRSCPVTKNVTVFFKAKEISRDHPNAPLLPPDCFKNNKDTNHLPIPKTVFQARNRYNCCRNSFRSIDRRRKFVFGAIYRKLWKIDYGYIDHEGKSSKCVIEVESPEKGSDGKFIKSNIIICSAENENNLLCGLVDLCKSLDGKKGKGNSRGKKVGDERKSTVLGWDKRNNRFYEPTKGGETPSCLERVCIETDVYLKKNFHLFGET